MTLHSFPFNFQKSVEAAGLFLSLGGGRMHNLRLMKLLYMADRQCLGREARTITGDKVYAMRRGPILSTVHNLIRGKHYQTPLWQHYIKTDKHDVVIHVNPDTGELCRFEKKIIENIYQETIEKDVVQITHTFPEWKKYENFLKDPSMKDSYRITTEDMLQGLGKPELITKVEEKIADMKSYNKLFRT